MALIVCHLLVPVLAVLGLAAPVISATGGAWHLLGALAAITGTISVYLGERALDPGPALGGVPRVVLAGLGAWCGLLCVTMLALDPPLWLYASPAIAAAWCYPLARRVPGLQLLLVATAWTTGGIWLASAGSAWDWPFAIAVGSIVAGATLLCDIKDIDYERARGIRDLAVRLGPGGSALVGALLISAGSIAGMILGVWALGLCLITAAIASKPTWLQHPIRAPLLIDASLTLPGWWWLLEWLVV